MKCFRHFLRKKWKRLDLVLPVEAVMLPACVRSFDLFEQMSLAQVKDIIIRLKLYIWWLRFLKEMVDDFGPSITYIINSSHHNGIVPMGLNQAVI